MGTLWNHTNSGLESVNPIEFGENPNYRSVRVRDVAFDSEGAMWSITSFVAKGLKKRSVDGNWRSVDLLPVLSSPKRAAGYSKLEISPNDEIYFGSSSSGLIGYAEINGTPVLRSIGVAENLPAEDVRSVALDYDDNLWIGTTNGLRVLYGASRMFTQEVSASTVVLEEGGNVGELLANQNIKAIEVDGNNQKWVATDGAGVFLFAEDGKKPSITLPKKTALYQPTLYRIWRMTINLEKSLSPPLVVLLLFKAMPLRHPKPWRI